MITPTSAQIQAACAAARKAIQDYSEFDSSMIPDDALAAVITAAFTAGINATPSKGNEHV